MNARKHLDNVLQYIFDHEYEDFQQNPTDTHVYYSAYVWEYGEWEARDLLKRWQLALEEQDYETV